MKDRERNLSSQSAIINNYIFMFKFSIKIHFDVDLSRIEARVASLDPIKSLFCCDAFDVFSLEIQGF